MRIKVYIHPDFYFLFLFLFSINIEISHYFSFNIGVAKGIEAISRSTCYQDNKICSFLRFSTVYYFLLVRGSPELISSFSLFL